MKQAAKNRFSVGRRVLVGMGLKPGTVQAVDDKPSVLGEFVHSVLVDGEQEPRRVIGCDMQPLPGFDEDLQNKRAAIHIQNSNVGNLNLGTQLGTISAAVQVISQGDESARQFSQAIQQLTNAVVASTLVNKQEVVDALATIADEGKKQPEARAKGTLRAIVAWLPTAIGYAADLTTLWIQYGPIIKAYLGIS